MAGLNDVAKAAGIKPEVLKSVVEAIQAVAATESVVIKGFGTFKTVTRAARSGRNPQTGAAIQIPAKTALTFKASK